MPPVLQVEVPLRFITLGPYRVLRLPLSVDPPLAVTVPGPLNEPPVQVRRSFSVRVKPAPVLLPPVRLYFSMVMA